MPSERQIFSLKQVVSSIRKTIEERYKQLYWVKAEMHKLNLYPSGHAFPELVQKEDDKIVAQIGGAIWKQNFQRINKQFVDVVKEPLKEGTTLLLQVKITYSETFGLSLQILDIDPSFTLGELQREREETLKRLQKEGILNANQRLEFPLLPQRIAIVSADTSKGLSDFMKVLDNNPWGYEFFTMLFPAYLQGDVAVSSIVEQLKKIEKVKHHFDVVVIVRGGGAEVGMSCYNHYELCKAIATFPLPILSGIGHSTNMTVTEMVAFRNAITPTELADFLIQTFHDFSVPVTEARKLLRTYSERLITLNKQHFESTAKQVRQHAVLYLERRNGQLMRTAEVMRRAVQHSLNLQHTNVSMMKSGISNLSYGTTERAREKMELAFQELQRAASRKLDQDKQMVKHLEDLSRILDPQLVLKRGFSITRLNGRTIGEHNAPEPGQDISIETFSEQLTAKLTAIETKKEE